MLSEEDKERIEVVETHKFEIRSKLATKKARKFGFGMLYSFFNSKFGLWLLSAIFVSGGVKVYDDYKVKQENEKTRGEIIEKLDNEIAFKFSSILASLEKIQGTEMEGVLDEEFSTLEDAKNFALSIKEASGKGEMFLYEEYKFWSLLALVVELKRQYKHLGVQDPEIDEVIIQVNELSKFVENRLLSAEDIKFIEQTIREKLLLSRWKLSSMFAEYSPQGAI